MQCGIGGVCASCIQKQQINGKTHLVYSCVSQEQPLQIIDFDNLKSRLSQNSLQEKLSRLLLSTQSKIDKLID